MFLSSYFPSMHLFVLVASVLTALLEIQIEGKNGFAAKLPTWKLKWWWYKKITNGKLLTGYHVYLNLLLLLFFHLPFLFSEWTLQMELLMFASFCLYTSFWDFLWFILNPAFGWQKYSKTNIWWFTVWLGPFPLDYYSCIGMSTLFAFLLPFAGTKSAMTTLQLIWQGLYAAEAWLFSVCLFLLVPTAIIGVVINFMRKSDIPVVMRKRMTVSLKNKRAFT